MTTKFEDCISIVGERNRHVCEKLRQHELRETRHQLKADTEDEAELVLKAAHKSGYSDWRAYVRDLTMQVLEVQTTALMVENMQLKAELAELKELAAQLNLVVKSQGQVEVDWQSVLRSVQVPGNIW